MRRRPARRRLVGRIRVSGGAACIVGHVMTPAFRVGRRSAAQRFSTLTLAFANILHLREYERLFFAVKSSALGNLRPVNERNNHSRQQHGRPDSNGVLREEMGHLF